LYSWEIKNSETTVESGKKLPSKILTFQPEIVSNRICPEVALLLPTISGTKSVLEQAKKHNQLLGDTVIGLFLSNVFVNFSKTVAVLQEMNIEWVCNLPTVGLYDDEFNQNLSEVRIGIQEEAKLLTEFKKLGFKTLAISSSEKNATILSKSNPDAVCVIPQAAAFAAGFPSLKLRKELETSVHKIFIDAGFAGTFLVYRDTIEAKKKTQAHILRPKQTGEDVGLLSAANNDCPSSKLISLFRPSDRINPAIFKISTSLPNQV